MENQVKRLVIRFGDNDFYYTMNALAHIILMRGTHSGTNPLPMDKERLAFMFNEFTFGCYLTFQNTFEYNGMEKMDEGYIKHMREYLTIEPKRILLNEEAVEYMQANTWDNSESVYIDIENNQMTFF